MTGTELLVEELNNKTFNPEEVQRVVDDLLDMYVDRGDDRFGPEVVDEHLLDETVLQALGKCPEYLSV